MPRVIRKSSAPSTAKYSDCSIEIGAPVALLREAMHPMMRVETTDVIANQKRHFVRIFVFRRRITTFYASDGLAQISVPQNTESNFQTNRGLTILVARLTARGHKRIFSLCHYFACNETSCRE